MARYIVEVKVRCSYFYTPTNYNMHITQFMASYNADTIHRQGGGGTYHVEFSSYEVMRGFRGKLEEQTKLLHDKAFYDWTLKNWIPQKLTPKNL